MSHKVTIRYLRGTTKIVWFIGLTLCYATLLLPKIPLLMVQQAFSGQTEEGLRNLKILTYCGAVGFLLLVGVIVVCIIQILIKSRKTNGNEAYRIIACESPEVAWKHVLVITSKVCYYLAITAVTIMGLFIGFVALIFTVISLSFLLE
ncbi:hypothetical protein EJ419_06460 [Alloscardovia theropitheci]|uniref:Uncharacterized protein n=1 Tax=Alloscardovia theropitheci TaxID=2496842 RepID=A0A4R0QX07_9BIFI|nr:hypothetical protein [Alloscardovia theropitheci]TCD53891.1 hypothetical protein EJ419_06460 [Alloscardovia theropitheci]